MSVYKVRQDATGAQAVNETETIFSLILCDSLTSRLEEANMFNGEAYTS